MRGPCIDAGHHQAGAQERVVPTGSRSISAVEDKSVRGKLENLRLLNTEDSFFDGIVTCDQRHRPAPALQLRAHGRGEALVEVGYGALFPTYGKRNTRSAGSRGR